MFRRSILLKQGSMGRLFFYSVFSIKSPTSQHSTCASMTRYSACALLMLFCRCSYCWIVRTGTPDKSASPR